MTSSIGVSTKDLTSIGGWLILVAIGQVVTPLILLKNVLELFQPDYMEVWKQAVQVGVLEFGLNAGVFVLGLWMVYSFFAKSKRWPNLFIWMLWLMVFVPLIDVVLVSALLDVPAEKLFDKESQLALIKSLFTAAIWTGYTTQSRRVKNTFVN